MTGISALLSHHEPARCPQRTAMKVPALRGATLSPLRDRDRYHDSELGMF